MKQTKLQKGFTLVETLVYVAIFSLFVLTASSYMGYLFSSRLKSETVMTVNEQGSQAIATIERIARNSTGVNTPSIGTSGGVLNVTTDNPATNPTSFSVVDDVLYIQEAVGGPVALTSNNVKVGNLVFSNLSRVGYPSTIQIRFTVSTEGLSDTPEGIYSNDFYGSVTLRK